MTTAIAVQNGSTDAATIMHDVITQGDLGKLSPDQKARYYAAVCESMGLNPTTKPFDYINLNGKLTLYATRTATDQLRKINGVSLSVISEETTGDGLRMVRVRAVDKTGRSDEEIGAVSVKGLGGDALANAYMKALTKAKRRATLSICGLGWLDESELETIPQDRVKRIQGPEIRPSVDVVADDDEAPVTSRSTPFAVDVRTGEVVGDMWTGAIEAAQTQDELAAIAMDIQKIPDASDGDKRLWRAAFNKRKTELAKANRAASEQLLETPADPDRFTA